VNHARSWKPSPSTAIALVALFVALAGTAWAAGLAKNSVKSKQIKDGQVLTQDIGDGAVTSAKIAPGVIPATGLADGAVTTPKLADSAVTGEKLGDDSVSAANVAADALGGPDIDESSLTGVDASSVGGLSASAFALVNHNHDATYVNEGQANSVDASMIPDAARAIQLPLRSFIDCDTDGGADINFTTGVDALPDFVGQAADGAGFVIRFDDTGGSPDSGSSICSQVMIPPDAAAGSILHLILRASRDANTAGAGESFSCAAAVNGGASTDLAIVSPSTASPTALDCGMAIAYAPHDLVTIGLTVNSAGGPMNDELDLHGVELEYVASR
jgi:hypothetical protein